MCTAPPPAAPRAVQLQLRGAEAAPPPRAFNPLLLLVLAPILVLFCAALAISLVTVSYTHLTLPTKRIV